MINSDKTTTGFVRIPDKTNLQELKKTSQTPVQEPIPEESFTKTEENPEDLTPKLTDLKEETKGTDTTKKEANSSFLKKLTKNKGLFAVAFGVAGMASMFTGCTNKITPAPPTTAAVQEVNTAYEPVTLDTSQLPANSVLAKGEAGPAIQRVAKLIELNLKVQTTALNSLNKYSVSPEEQKNTLEVIGTFKSAVTESHPLYYSLNHIPPETGFTYIYDDKGNITSMIPYTNYPHWSSESTCGSLHHKAMNALNEIEDITQKSLQQAGPATAEKVGTIFKKSVDQRIKEEFSKVNSSLTKLMERETIVNQKGDYVVFY